MTAHSKGPTLEQLHTVWLRRTQKGSLWPQTFEEAMEHPLLSRILKIRSLHNEVQAMVKREGPHLPDSDSSPVSKWLRHGLDHHAYWMDSDLDEEDSTS